MRKREPDPRNTVLSDHDLPIDRACGPFPALDPLPRIRDARRLDDGLPEAISQTRVSAEVCAPYWTAILRPSAE